jgi:hypothetical protein
MKKLTKLVILATVFLAVCIPLVSAWNVDSYTIDPSGPLTPNTSVNVSFMVEFPTSTSGTTFPAGSDLVMATALVNPTWSYTITTGDGGSAVVPSFTNQTLDLSGFILSYQGHVSQVMGVTLTGTTPPVSTTTPKTILNVHEVDRTGKVITSSQVIQTAVVSGSDQTSRPNSNTNQQSGLLDQIIGMFKSLFGMQS